MAKLSPPHSSAVVDVNDDDVKRYKEAGWTEAKSSGSTARKATASKPSSDKK